MTHRARTSRFSWALAFVILGCSALFGESPDKYHPRTGTSEGGIEAGADTSVAGSGAGLGNVSDSSSDHPSDRDGDAGSVDTDVVEFEDPDAGVAPRGSLWRQQQVNDDNLELFPDFAIPVCFTHAPHREWSSALRCRRQTEHSACSGEPFDGTDDAALREQLRALLEETWGRVASFTFVKFDECPLTTSGDHDSHTLPASVMVTFVTKASASDSPTSAVTGIGEHDEYASDVHVDWQGLNNRDPEALRGILREFGRVLGLPYEFLRGSPTDASTAPQAPTQCPPTWVEDPDRAWIKRPMELIDYGSVLDRCTPADSRTGLSPGDVIAIQSLYGPKHNGAFVSNRGRCLTATNSEGSESSIVNSTSPCWYWWGDSWFRSSSGQVQNQLRDYNRCLSLSGSLDGTVLSASCTTSGAQSVAMTNLEWRTMGNMCIEAVHLPAGDDELQLAECNGSAAQRWTFWDGDPNTTLDWTQIQSVPTGTCVSTRTGVKGDHLILAPCAVRGDEDFTKQSFGYLRGGFIHTPELLCLNVLGGQPQPGLPVGLWGGCGYATYYNSQFYVSGPLSILGKCIEAQDATGGSDGVQGVQAVACAPDAQNQVWDFHF